jgi:dTDP-4-amino-4,6-dideoxygalactose transaminase
MNSNSIPFNEPYMTGRELWYIAQAHTNGHLSGDGMFTKKCHAWLEARTGAQKALLIHSCTAALEMAAILADMVVHGESWQSLANSPIGWRGYRCGSD